jgi:hypothetical protein
MGRIHQTVHVSDDPDEFPRIALQALKLLGGEFGTCADGLDQSYWDLHADGGMVTIHREHYLGVCVFCDEKPESVQLLTRYATAIGAPMTASIIEPGEAE